MFTGFLSLNNVSYVLWLSVTVSVRRQSCTQSRNWSELAEAMQEKKQSKLHKWVHCWHKMGRGEESSGEALLSSSFQAQVMKQSLQTDENQHSLMQLIKRWCNCGGKITVIACTACPLWSLGGDGILVCLAEGRCAPLAFFPSFFHFGFVGGWLCFF